MDPNQEEYLVNVKIQSVIRELTRPTPTEVEIPPRPYEEEDTPKEKVHKCIEIVLKSKMMGWKNLMLIHLYYIGEVIEKETGIQQRNYSKYKTCLTAYYWRIAIKTFLLFEYYGIEQTMRANIGTALIYNLRISEIDQIRKQYIDHELSDTFDELTLQPIVQIDNNDGQNELEIPNEEYATPPSSNEEVNEEEN